MALEPQAVEFLRAHRAHVVSRCALLGVTPDPDGFVFSRDPDGSRPRLPRSVSQPYRRMAIKRGLRSTRLHALRHYTATELLAAGVDLRTVAGRLGHSDNGVTTLRVYAGRVNEADRRAATTLAELMPVPDPARRQPRSPYERIAGDLRAQVLAGHLSALHDEEPVKLPTTTRERSEDLIRLYITPTLASTPPGGDVGDPAPGDGVAPRQVV